MDELDCLHLTVCDKLHHFYNNTGLNSHCGLKHNNSNTFATFHLLKCFFLSRSLAPEMPNSSGGLALTRYDSTQITATVNQLKPISCSSIHCLPPTCRSPSAVTAAHHLTFYFSFPLPFTPQIHICRQYCCAWEEGYRSALSCRRMGRSWCHQASVEHLGAAK